MEGIIYALVVGIPISFMGITSCFAVTEILEYFKVNIHPELIVIVAFSLSICFTFLVLCSFDNFLNNFIIQTIDVFLSSKI